MAKSWISRQLNNIRAWVSRMWGRMKKAFIFGGTNPIPMPGKLLLTASELAAARVNFQNNYSAGAPGFAADLEVPWTDFQAAATAGSNPGYLVLRFIHRYEADLYRWYLSVAPCSFSGYSGPGDYAVNTYSPAFDIRPDGSIGSLTPGLYTNGGYYCPVYFSNVLENSLGLSLSTHVRSQTVAWEELRQLHAHNKAAIPGADDSLFTIRFSAVSFDYSEAPAEASVDYPHALAYSMVYDGLPCLDEEVPVSGAPFTNKAADFNTLCPAKCENYTWPAGLTP